MTSSLVLSLLNHLIYKAIVRKHLFSCYQAADERYSTAIMLLLNSPTSWSLLQQASMAAASGVASHLCFYIHGEHHMKAPILFKFYTVLFFILLYGEVVVKDQGTFRGTTETLSISAAHTLSLLTSIAIYRIFFHRLRKFPGPFMAGVTKLWHTANVLDSQNHTLLDGLYEQYGDFVRTGKWTELPSTKLN